MNIRREALGIITMKTTKVLLLALSLVFMNGCAALETTPKDVAQKLAHPLNGHLYDPHSVNTHPKLAAY
jgi:hypothetical protein